MNIKNDFLQLVKACNKDEELLDFVELSMNKMTNYVSKVVHMEYALPLYNARYEGEEFRDKVQKLDESRRSAHEAAIAAVNSLNRLAKNLQVEPIFKGDIADRYQVADFCEMMVHEFFSERSGVPEHKINEYVDIAEQEEKITVVKDNNSTMQVTRKEYEQALLDGNPYTVVENDKCYIEVTEEILMRNIPTLDIEH